MGGRRAAHPGAAEAGDPGAVARELSMEPGARPGVGERVRRAAKLWVAGVIVFVGAGAVVRATRPEAPRVIAGLEKQADKGVEAAWVGRWVWSRVVEDGQTTLAIDDADLVQKVGPSGWPGCPERFVCTRYGLRSLVLGADGTFFYAAHPETSSDFQAHGSWAAGRVWVDTTFSCAHPGWRRPPLRAALHAERRGDALWVAISRGPPTTLPFAPAPTGRWLVFRRVTRSRFEAIFPRLCQPSPGRPCHPRCFARLP